MIIGAILAVVVALGALLRLHDVLDLSLSYDEGATFYFSQLPLSELWGEAGRQETNPPLFYSIVRLLHMLGMTPEEFRYASVVLGTLCVVVTYCIGWLMGGRFTGVSAAILVATSGVQIAMSQDARAYSLLTLSALVALASLVWLLKIYRDGGGRGAALSAWAGFAAGNVVALYAHNTAVVTVAAFDIVALWVWWIELRLNRGFAVGFCASNLVIGVLYAFWVPVVIHQSITTLAHFWLSVPTLRDLRYEIESIYGQRYAELFPRAQDAVFMVVALFGVGANLRRGPSAAIAVFVVAGAPAASWAISQWRPIMNGKTLVWLVPIFLCFVALGIARLGRARGAALAVAVLLNLTADQNYFNERGGEGWRHVALALKSEALPGDILYVDPLPAVILLDYYGSPRQRLSIFGPQTVAWFRAFDGEYADVDQFAVKAAGMRRVWVVTHQGAGIAESLEHELSPALRVVQRSLFGADRSRTAELTLFVAPDTEKSHLVISHHVPDRS